MSLKLLGFSNIIFYSQILYLGVKRGFILKPETETKHTRKYETSFPYKNTLAYFYKAPHAAQSFIAYFGATTLSRTTLGLMESMQQFYWHKWRTCHNNKCRSAECLGSCESEV
jgi:hypothetical protein